MAKRAAMSDLDFVSKCLRVSREGGGLDELAALVGLKRNSVLAKRSALRAKGWTIPEFTRGSKGGETVNHAPTEEDFVKLAELMGQTVDEVKAASIATIETVQKRAAAIKAGKAEAGKDGAAS